MDAEMKAGKLRLRHTRCNKNNIDTADKMLPGSLALEILLQRCFVVERLRDAGAIIISKTE
jgi:Asp-tRNA(Asn)/Glu-tRNA(Gln) amidotransferase A subunit family amidase